VATAHGNELANLVKNPTLSDLVGGIESVTLGDEEARRRRSQKTVLERAAEPTFPLAVEMHRRDRWLVHADVAQTVDLLLRGQPVRPQVRELAPDGMLRLEPTPPPVPGMPAAPPRLCQRPLPPQPPPPAPPGRWVEDRDGRSGDASGADRAPRRAAAPVPPLRVYGAGIGRSQLEQVVRARCLPVELAPSVELADVVLSVRQQLGRDPQVRRQAHELGIPILVIKSAVLPQVQRGLERLLERRRAVPGAGSTAADTAAAADTDDDHAALEECRLAVEQVVLPQGRPVELLPRSERVRRLQAELAARYQLRWAEFGRGQELRLRLFPA